MPNIHSTRNAIDPIPETLKAKKNPYAARAYASPTMNDDSPLTAHLDAAHLDHENITAESGIIAEKLSQALTLVLKSVKNLVSFASIVIAGGALISRKLIHVAHPHSRTS